MGEVTKLLSTLDSGDPHAGDQLLLLVYDELRRLAARHLAHENPGHTLQPTALVHEAYLRLVGAGGETSWDNRRHFFAAAAEAMRRILVESARRRASLKRGGGGRRTELDEQSISCHEKQFDLLDIDDVLRELERHDPQAAMLVKLRFFAGMSHQEAAQAVGVSRGAADRLWTLARAWLYQQLGDR